MSACGERGGYTGSAESGLSWSMHSHDIDSALTANRIRFYWERGLSLTLEIAVHSHVVAPTRTPTEVASHLPL
jgi:hypothetical protein